MAISTYGTYLLEKRGKNDWVKLVDIKSAPELGGKPERLETTTLSNINRTYIPGIKDFGESEFQINYDKAAYTKLDKNSGSKESKKYAVALGIDKENPNTYGVDGFFTFTGNYFVSKDSAEVNGVQGATLTFYMDSDVVFMEASEKDTNGGLTVPYDATQEGAVTG